MEYIHIRLHLNWGNLRILLIFSERILYTRTSRHFLWLPTLKTKPLTQSLVVWSLNHRMTEVGRHLWRMPSQTPLLTAGLNSWLFKDVSGSVLSISKSRDSTTSLGNMCQCLVTLAVKQLVLILKLNFLYFNVGAKSREFGGFLTRDVIFGTLYSPWLPVTNWCPNFLLCGGCETISYSSLVLWNCDYLKFQVLGIEHDEVEDYMQDSVLSNEDCKAPERESSKNWILLAKMW